MRTPEKPQSSADHWFIAWSSPTNRPESQSYRSQIPKRAFEDQFRPDLFAGVVVLKHPGAAYDQPLDQEPLYETLEQAAHRKVSPVSLTFIPYYAWANREPSAMEVWIPVPIRYRTASVSGRESVCVIRQLCLSTCTVSTDLNRAAIARCVIK